MIDINGIGLVVTIIFGVITTLIALYPIIVERRKNRTIQKTFSQGPYDQFTIKQAVQYYIRPKCSVIDPGMTNELEASETSTDEDLFERVNKFLNNKNTSSHHLILLSETGMGKTSFLLNYYEYNSHRLKNLRSNIVLVPLGIKDADKLISETPNQEDKVIFLDGYDEDSKAIANHGSRMIEIMNLCRKYKKVIITCRTQFFFKDEEIPSQTGLLRIGPRAAGEKSLFEFSKVSLVPFSEKQIKQYLKKRFPIWQYWKRKQAYLVIDKIQPLSVRPMLLSFIPELLKSEVEIQYTFQIFEALITAWIQRERGYTFPDEFRKISELLAVDLYINREKRGMERVSYDELLGLSKIWGITLNDWQITSRSLLNRDSQGNYKFSHRSFMEYLFITSLLNNNENCYGVILTPQMVSFLTEMLSIKFPSILSITNLFNSAHVVIINNKRDSIKAWPTAHIENLPPIELELLYSFWKNDKPKKEMGAKEVKKTALKSVTKTHYWYHHTSNDKMDMEQDYTEYIDYYMVQTILTDEKGQTFEFEFEVEDSFCEERLLPWIKERSNLKCSTRSFHTTKHDHTDITTYTLANEIMIFNEQNLHRFIKRFTLSTFEALIDINESQEIKIEPALPSFDNVKISLNPDTYRQIVSSNE